MARALQHGELGNAGSPGPRGPADPPSRPGQLLAQRDWPGCSQTFDFGSIFPACTSTALHEEKLLCKSTACFAQRFEGMIIMLLMFRYPVRADLTCLHAETLVSTGRPGPAAWVSFPMTSSQERAVSVLSTVSTSCLGQSGLRIQPSCDPLAIRFVSRHRPRLE